MAAIRTRPLENLLKFKPKNKEKRKVIYKKLITALVQYERIETTINRCHDLSRVAERVSKLRKKTQVVYAPMLSPGWWGGGGGGGATHGIICWKPDI